ncbi:hypothetical protein [Bathymodiolus septemdierum thioautotrophic gill symbiont]|uniref:Uncharacterized protein n=1 Tax=endosymbiont of Bathymodiolus septemdierum str. Myojin knoll TaxID=1303921 RepID=A0A0P0UTJ6_9GAMM|nr:hypothetical protein [Bathymodiolus septemdierum thioautotrophic gill symbiont]BAS68392.1 hypothetical protein BSEPE_1413 [endosymbiont of Bathymodiolus septemdierum str. Myojin knoll]
MKNVKTLLLATLVSFMMVTSPMANSISSDANLIFSNGSSQAQSMDFARLSTTEMKKTEGEWFWVAWASASRMLWSRPAY